MRVLVPVIALSICLCTNEATAAQLTPESGVSERGRVLVKELTYGRYLQYIPTQLASPVRIAVLVHGSLGENEPALTVAERFIKRWIPEAEKRKLVVLAPAFDQENFGGRAGPGGGYRGLFGRQIGADEFVNRIVDQYKSAWPSFDGEIYLYGHSAGGQFVSRYVVMHPERVRATVISAAGTFAFPNPDVPWTNGMGRLRRTMQWGEADEPKRIDIQPDPGKWLRAATLPITVVVGRRDTEGSKAIPGQEGRTLVERARRWVAAMNRLARDHQKVGRLRLVVVEGAGHSSAQLTPVCMEHLFRE